VTSRRSVLAGALAVPLASAAATAAPAAAAPPGPSAAAPPARGSAGRDRRPLVIGHRGASGYRPEHTLAAYELAARQGADYLEPDLVPTRDGVLVCRHEPEIGGTTDVANRPEFADRKKTVALDGVPVTGWFTEDFTLAELKTLRAVERLPQVRQENTIFDGRYQVPTFAELLALRRRLSRELGRELGVYPETKHPTYFQEIGLDLEPMLLQTLRRAGLNRPQAPVFVQSFEVANLRRLRRLGLRTAVVQLLSASGSPYDTVARGSGPTYAELASPAGLRGIARYADGIGPEKGQVIPRLADGTLGSPSSLVADAHAAGLLVHPYTFRAENTFLPVDYRIGTDPTDFGRAIDEQVTFLRTGIDGLFTDHPDIGVVARTEALSRVDA
jgi:glycerophosphoryl diester phosphodiesterase